MVDDAAVRAEQERTARLVEESTRELERLERRSKETYRRDFRNQLWFGLYLVTSGALGLALGWGSPIADKIWLVTGSVMLGIGLVAKLMKWV